LIGWKRSFAAHRIVFDLFDASLPDELGGPLVGKKRVGHISKKARFRRNIVSPILNQAEAAAIKFFAFSFRNALDEERGSVFVDLPRICGVTVEEIDSRAVPPVTYDRRGCRGSCETFESRVVYDAHGDSSRRRRRTLDVCKNEGRCDLGRGTPFNKNSTLRQFRILFLDKRNVLIADEVQGHGTVDHTPVYPREVVRRALELSATALILIHNHPSGDPTPSRADIEMTKTIIDTAKPLGIAVHDHIIIGKDGHASFKGLRLI